MYKKLDELIKNNNKITLFTHIDPDGDTIGSSFALKELINLNYENKEVKISGDIAPRYLWKYDGREEVDNNFFNNSLHIVIDTSTASRIADRRVNTSNSIKIDHHPNEGDWMLKIFDPSSPANGQVIYKIIEELNWKINKNIQQGIFISIWTDTEGLTQRNVTDRTLKIMDTLEYLKEETLKSIALNLKEYESVDYFFKKIEGDSTLSHLITEEEITNDIIRQVVGNNSNNTNSEVFAQISKSGDIYRGELRSKGRINVSIIAKELGGGGHITSSGFKLKTLNKKEILLKIRKLINEQL